MKIKFRGGCGDYWLEVDGKPVIFYDDIQEWRSAARRFEAGQVVLHLNPDGSWSRADADTLGTHQQNPDGSWSPAVPLSYSKAPLWRRILGKVEIVFLTLIIGFVMAVVLVLGPAVLRAWLES